MHHGTGHMVRGEVVSRGGEVVKSRGGGGGPVQGETSTPPPLDWTTSPWTPPPQDTYGNYGQWASGTHPTGMHS